MIIAHIFVNQHLQLTVPVIAKFQLCDIERDLDLLHLHSQQRFHLNELTYARLVENVSLHSTRNHRAQQDMLVICHSTLFEKII